MDRRDFFRVSILGGIGLLLGVKAAPVVRSPIQAGKIGVYEGFKVYESPHSPEIWSKKALDKFYGESIVSQMQRYQIKANRRAFVNFQKLR